jgi:hypothetical protein
MEGQFGDVLSAMLAALLKYILANGHPVWLPNVRDVSGSGIDTAFEPMTASSKLCPQAWLLRSEDCISCYWAK